MSNLKILIIGGYGTVGRTISSILVKQFPNKVVVAGRNIRKAILLSEELGKMLIPLEFDISSIAEMDVRLNDIKTVVVCIDQNNNRFAKQCLERGINYIDISAKYKFISSVESLNSIAIENQATAILSVGLAPGLSNLLAKHAQLKKPKINQINIAIQLGLGEKHGQAAIKWSLNDINDNYFVVDNNAKVLVGSMQDPRTSLFLTQSEKRNTYRSNFSDQHTISKNLHVGTVSTRICFDSKLMTWLFAKLRQTGLSYFIKFTSVQKVIIFCLRHLKFGTNKFIVQVEAGVNGEIQYKCAIDGSSEGVHTGLVAAITAKKLHSQQFEKGVFHIEQLFNPLQFINEINSSTLRFSEEYYI